MARTNVQWSYHISTWLNRNQGKVTITATKFQWFTINHYGHKNMSNEAPRLNKNQGKIIIILTKFLQVTTIQGGHKKCLMNVLHVNKVQHKSKGSPNQFANMHKIHYWGMCIQTSKIIPKIHSNKSRCIQNLTNDQKHFQS